MAAEARAMLDALMGSDRNAEIPTGETSNNLSRKKKSCYDRGICPFYCAWGVDVYELFTNTRSDIGPNPNAVQSDARDEFLSLPDHEKDRLGYEFMLYRKLADLVRGCDRIVNRNKEALRQEIAKAARARGKVGRKIDPATDVSDEMLLEAAEIMADLELREEEVSCMLKRVIEYDEEWKTLYEQVQSLQKEDDSSSSPNENENSGKDQKQDGNDDIENTVADVVESSTEKDGKDIQNDENDTNSNDAKAKDSGNDKDDDQSLDKINQIKEIKSKLYKISAEQQKLISSLSSLTSQTIVPLRDNLQNFTKQMYYVKTDTSSDKSVCEVSGNFMSSRDAEERIAAHYAGKQYVGWKMVRDKVKELHKKYANRRPPNNGGGGGRMYPLPHGGYRDQRGPPGGGYNNNYRGPPPGGPGGYSNDPRGPPGGGYGGGTNSERDRSRSRDSRNQRRRSPSPPRWRRDRGYGGRR